MILTLAIAAAISCTTDSECAAQDVAIASQHGIALDYRNDDPLSTPVVELLPNGTIRLSCYALGDTLYNNGAVLTCATLPRT